MKKVSSEAIAVKETKVKTSSLSPAIVILAIALGVATIAFGIDSLAPGAHDTFHDFRHTIGMPCH